MKKIMIGVIIVMTMLVLLGISSGKFFEEGNTQDEYGVEDVETLMYIDVTDFSLHPNIHYRKKGQAKRECNREIYYSDMDSITVCRWDSLTDKEKLHAIRESFSFDLDESEWNKYSDSENLKMILSNTFVEWERTDL